MKYTLSWSNVAQREMKKLDGFVQRRIAAWLTKNVDGSDDPRKHGKALSENLAGFWRYRIGDFRVICIIKDDVCMVTAVHVGHRSIIYNN